LAPENGTGLKVTQKTNYPWDGRVDITVTSGASVGLYFPPSNSRMDRKRSSTVNNKPVAGVTSGKYLPIQRKWAAGDVIRLQMEMPSQVIRQSPGDR